MIAGPALLLGVLLLASGVAYLARRIEAVAALVAAAVTGVLALMLGQLPLTAAIRVAGRPIFLGQPLTLGGLSLRITAASRPLLILLLAAAAVTFVLAWRTYQGRTFYPFGLALVALWSSVILLQPLLFAPFGLVLTAILAVFLIQAGRPGETRGAWRQLLFPTLSLPIFVVAGWYIDQAPLNPDDTSPYRIAGWLLIAGFVLLLQPAPLHVAIPAVAEQSPPVVAAFLWIGGQAVTLYLLQRFLVTYPWLSDAVDSARWLLWLGVLTAVLGGLLAAVQRRLGRMMGYAAVYDYGVMIVALGLGGTAGLPTAIWLLITRTFALLTLATGAAIIRHHMEGDRISQLSGAVSRLPLAVCALIVGGFALAGMPLTAQFASRWALIQLVAENDPRWAFLLLVGALGVVAATVRCGQACFGGLTDSPVEREPRSAAMLAALLILCGVLLGLLPQLLTGPVASAILPLATLGQ